MSTVSPNNLEQRLRELHRYIQEGRVLDAMNEFYADDVAMQENANPPTVGLQANVERERQFLGMVKEWKGFEVKTVGVGHDVTIYEAVLDFIRTDGAPVHFEQVAVARWRDGKIIHERFYYDTGSQPAS